MSPPETGKIMLSVSEAQERILAHFHPVGAESMRLADAVGRVLSKDVEAPLSLPPFDNSSMDGFALRAADSQGAAPESPRTLKVVADIPAGSDPSGVSLAPTQAARIMTGAPLPPGADAVIPVEDTDFTNRDPGSAMPENVTIYRPVHPGDYVRPSGSDVAAGQTVLAAGRRLAARELGLLALLGVAFVEVHHRPRIALLSSGDELLPIDAPLAPGKIHDANSLMLATQLASAGAEVLPLGIAADRAEDVRARLDRAVAARVDLILSSAGVSVGAMDHIKGVVESAGDLDFWKVNMRPGKPLAFGAYRGIPFAGLPGNPVSAFVTFEIFIRPAIERLGGLPSSPRPRVRARLEEPIESDGRESYLRAILREEAGQWHICLAGSQSSGNLLSLVQANALLIVPAGVKSLATGQEAEAWFLSDQQPEAKAR
jgi:molybdopterin molybdotransferase